MYVYIDAVYMYINTLKKVRGKKTEREKMNARSSVATTYEPEMVSLTAGNKKKKRYFNQEGAYIAFQRYIPMKLREESGEYNSRIQFTDDLTEKGT